MLALQSKTWINKRERSNEFQQCLKKINTNVVELVLKSVINIVILT